MKNIRRTKKQKLIIAKALFESGSVGDIAQAQALYTEAQREMSAWTPGELDFSQITASASKAGGDAGDAYLEAFEDEFKQLKELFDDGLITENQYLDRLRVLYQRYFKERKEYVREYAQVYNFFYNFSSPKYANICYFMPLYGLN